ncbi:MAG TPA: hypothetical protein PKA58_07895 [Polyangium sp.]|nr:hypothetical protein [Polyangium sp.]
MDGHVPRAGTAHREPADRDAIFVDAITLLHRRHRLEHIDLAGQFEGVVPASVRMQHDRVGGSERPDARRSIAHEVQFSQHFASAVEPEIKSDGRRAAVARRHDQAVRLHGAVETRDVATHDETGCGRPRGPAGEQIVGPLLADRELLHGVVDLFRLMKLLVLQRDVDSLVVDRHVRPQLARLRIGLRLERGDRGAELLQAGFQLRSLLGRHFDAELREPPDFVLTIVGRTVGSQRRGRDHGPSEHDGRRDDGRSNTVA